ncbi:hypothetical protein RF11_06059 [Thelohanellus kitauei]|uniref:Uncharacterized protein n=1 Tax=Thelohanellus kitauei TaxID=669202 RepID=A0A0C2MJJ8_THEKT|nr:hypothetical protein RF11_06059 [Thelohanellus kitauei]
MTAPVPDASSMQRNEDNDNSKQTFPLSETDEQIPEDITSIIETKSRPAPSSDASSVFSNIQSSDTSPETGSAETSYGIINNITYRLSTECIDRSNDRFKLFSHKEILDVEIRSEDIFDVHYPPRISFASQLTLGSTKTQLSVILCLTTVDGCIT